MFLFSVTDSELINRIKEAGEKIYEKYCNKMPDQPTMLPPIPNCSKFIDKFPEEGCSEDNEKDKRKQEAYAAEVKVYRALESLEEDIVVLHSLRYTNRQLKLFKKDHQFDEDEPNKEAGECDFVAIGKNYIIIIEVSDVRIDNEITSNKRVKTAFKRKKKQAARTRELIEHIIKQVQSADNFEKGTLPLVKWYCAFLSLSSETEAQLNFEGEQKSNIIFSDSFGPSDTSHDHKSSFHQWWGDNVTNAIAKDSFYDIQSRYILLGLWNIDSQNKVNLEQRCSFGSNIMKIDSQLRDAEITYGFRNPKNPGYNNSNFVPADTVFKAIGIKYLSKEQEEVFKSEERFLWINGPAGSGKTLLILGKAIQAAKSGEYVVIFTNGSGARSMENYNKAFTNADVKFNIIDWSKVNRGEWSFRNQEKNVARQIDLCIKDPTDPCRIVILPSLFKSRYTPYNLYWGEKESLEVIRNVISETRVFGGECAQWNFFVDDEQLLLNDRCYDRKQLRIQEIKELAREYCLIWVFSDITQSYNHTGQENFKSLLSSMDSLKETYSNPMLSLNLRNTFNIAILLKSLIRESTLISTKQKESHFIHGPVPVIHYLHSYKNPEHRYSYFGIEDIIEKELDKIFDCEEITVSDIGFIQNFSGYEYEHWIHEIVRKKKDKGYCSKFRTCKCVNELEETYSAEWPAVVFLMDLEHIEDFDYKIVHQLYLGISRARVYFVAVLLSSRYRTRSYTIQILKKLEKYAKLIVYNHSSGEKTIGYKLNKPASHYEGECALQRAIEYGNLKNVLDVIETGADINISTWYMTSPLHYAIDKAKLEVVQFLVKHGADINYSSKSPRGYSSTPLSHAVKQGKQDIVQYLIESGADVNYGDLYKKTPLHFATEGNLCIVEYLLKFGANVNSRDSNKETPLHWAVKNRNLDVVQYLVKSGADLNSSDSYEKTPLYLAAKTGKLDIVQYLVQSGANFDYSTMKLHDPLHVAAEHGYLEIVCLLVESGFDVNFCSGYEYDMSTPLHIAAEKGNLEVAQYLVRSGADVNCGTSEMCTPLHNAVRYQAPLELVKYLVESGANINSSTSDLKMTPIHFASELDIIRYLVESGADVNCKDSENSTPLHRIIWFNRYFLATAKTLDIMRYLVNSGANVNCRDSKNLFPLHFAVMNGNVEVVQCLIESGAEVDCKTLRRSTPLHFAAQYGVIGIVQYLKDSGANIHSSNSYLLTSIHLSAYHGKLDIVQYLANSGANVNCSGPDNLTPLHLAVRKGFLEIVQCLKECGADLNCKTLNKLTPLHYAVHHEQLDIVKYLVESGADMNCSSSDGVTPLHLAVRKYKPLSIRCLLKAEEDVDCSISDQLDLLEDVQDEDEKLKFVKCFVHSEADLNCGDSKKSTPLHYAVENMNMKIVQCLVESGADVNSMNSEMVTPLHIAENNGNLDIVEYLQYLVLEHGAHVNCTTSEKINQLQDASMERKLDLIRYLVKSGAENDNWKGDVVKYFVGSWQDNSSCTSDKLTPLHTAVKYDDQLVVQYLE